MASLSPLGAIGAMAVVFLVATRLGRLDVAFGLMLAGVAGPLVAGFGLPLRHLVEGTFGFLYLVLILCAGLVFFAVLREAGALDVLASDLVRLLGRAPTLLLCFLTLLLMLPGMLTGFGGVAVLTVGVLAAPILGRLGVPGPEAAAIIALASIFGMVAPPVNFPALLIVDGVNMPYAGFGAVLSLLSFPLALGSSLYLGARHLRPILPIPSVAGGADGPAVLAPAPPAAAAAPGRAAGARGARLAAYVSLGLVGLLAVLTRTLPALVPDVSTPLLLMVGAVAAALCRPRAVRFLVTSADALRGSGLHLIGVLLGVGMVIQALTLTGGRGLLVVWSLSLPGGLLLLSALVALPVLGGVLTALGVSTVLGVPLALAFVDKDMIVAVAGLSLIASLAELVRPTAISGALATHVVPGVEYRAVWRRAAGPAVVAGLVGVLAVLFANPLGRLLAAVR